MKFIRNSFSFIKLYTALTLFDIELNRKGFSNIFDSYSRKYYIELGDFPEKIEIDTYEIDAYSKMLDLVCTWYPRKADCIHKTFLSYKYLRKKYKLPVDMVVGIRKFPFEAHAWLLLGNENFFSEDTRQYKIILNSKKDDRGYLYELVPNDI